MKRFAKAIWMNILSVLMIPLFVLPIWGGATVDFSAGSDRDWRVWAGGFSDAANPQLSFSNAGMHLRLDSQRTKGARRMATPGPLKRPVFQSPCKLRLWVLEDGDSILSDRISLGFIDSQGEKFEFFPSDVVRCDGKMLLVYDVFDYGWRDGFCGSHPRKGRTSGMNRNDRIDFPLKFDLFYVRLKEGYTKGDITFLHMEDDIWNGEVVSSKIRLFNVNTVDDLSDWRIYGPASCRNGKIAVTGMCSVAAIEHTRFPGLKPVHGMSDILVKTSRAYSGGVVEVRVVNAATRERKRFKVPWCEDTRIPTSLEYGNLYQVDMLTFWIPKNARDNVEFEVESVYGVCRTSCAQAVELDVETGNALHLIPFGSDSAPQITIRNTSSAHVSLQGVARVRDYHGEGFDVPLMAKLDGGGQKSVSLPSTLKKGIWRVLCEWQADNGSREQKELRFAVTDFANAGDRWPRGRSYRMGVCYHPVYYSMYMRELALDALTYAGVKLVRINGFDFARCGRGNGQLDWTQADQIQEMHRSRGISISAGFGRTPPWATDVAEKKVKHNFSLPPRPGLMRSFSQELGSRYGTKIDYYELGNEWDLVPESVLSEDEALRVHREAFEGLKEGCPAVKLITNGWSTDMEYKGRYVRDGFQKRYVQNVKGICDVHSVHMHGPFRKYVKSVEAHLSAREKYGIDMPWFSNETAQTVTGGAEIEVAATVWKKILYAWAGGSIDYIWYNLFASGWMPSDDEQGYGLFTADYYPRATYPSLSGIIGAMQGHEFKATLVKSPSRYLFSFKGNTDKFNGVAVAGWLEDGESSPSRSFVTFRTDAKRAFLTDMFGNRTPIEISDGTVKMPLSLEPCAMLLCEATDAVLTKTEDLK